jgi:hypothetical protein
MSKRERMNHNKLYLIITALFFSTYVTPVYSIDNPICQQLADQKKRNDDAIKQLNDNINYIDQTTMLLNQTKTSLDTLTNTYKQTSQLFITTKINGKSLIDISNDIKTNIPLIKDSVNRYSNRARSINVAVLARLPQTSADLVDSLIRLTALTLYGNAEQFPNVTIAPSGLYTQIPFNDGDPIITTGAFGIKSDASSLVAQSPTISTAIDQVIKSLTNLKAFFVTQKAILDTSNKTITDAQAANNCG